MRVSEERYLRDLRRLHLAQRMISHEVRTTTICAWTGFNEERIRNLAKSYKVSAAHRHRGPPPQKVDVFLRHTLLRAEAACLGGLARAFKALPARPVTDAPARLPNIVLGERLCQTYEVYRRMVPQARLTLEHCILIVLALASQDEIQLEACSECRAALIIERGSHERRQCFACRFRERNGLGEEEEPVVSDRVSIDGVQQSLF